MWSLIVCGRSLRVRFPPSHFSGRGVMAARLPLTQSARDHNLPPWPINKKVCFSVFLWYGVRICPYQALMGFIEIS